MPNSRRYMDFNRGDNEWLSEPPTDPDTQEEWAEAWAELKKECPHQIEFTEDIYCNSEHDGPPDWIDVHINDDYVLNFKMALGVIKSMQSADFISFSRGFDCDVEKSWGAIGYERLSIHAGQVYVTINAKHGGDEIEVNITEQFNQAIGEV
jgi:hypothetical protein